MNLYRHLTHNVPARDSRALKRSYLFNPAPKPEVGILPPDQTLLPQSTWNPSDSTDNILYWGWGYHPICLAQHALPTPAIPVNQATILYLTVEAGVGFIKGICNPFSFKSQPVEIEIDETRNLDYWDLRRTFAARIIRLGGDLPVQVRRFHHEGLARYLMIAQQNFYLSQALEKFQNLFKRQANLINLVEAELVAIVHVVELHVLVQINQEGKVKASTLQEHLTGKRTQTSDTNYYAPKIEGESPLKDFLHAFTHFTFEYNNHTAVVNGFQVRGNTIWEHVMVDTSYPWHAGYSGSRIMDFYVQHECKSLCHRLALPGLERPW